jgi:uncharacterized cupin superfamily protein
MTKKLLKSPVTSWQDIESKIAWQYPGSKETHGLSARFADHLGLGRLGVHHHRLRPGERSSWPHAEEEEDEFVFVIEGTPELWSDGHVGRLSPGDGVGFKSGTGIAHTFINNTEQDVRMIVVGEPSRQRARVNYPLHPKRNRSIGEIHWNDAPKRKLGPHNGEPDRPRHQRKSKKP